MTPLLATWIPPASVLRFKLASDLPRLDLIPNAIRQVVMNLVKNAAEAVSDRPGIVTVSTGWIELTAGLSVVDERSAERSVRHVCLTVSDTGCGIDEPTRARLQEGACTTKPNGHGLGLASVRRIVAAHGARLRLSSRAGTGTTACVAFGDGSPVNNQVSVPIDPMQGLLRATEDICVLPLVQGVASRHRMDPPVRSTRAHACDSAALIQWQA
ncbi:MAG: ATP-binding protein [Planctomycetaceae bacterium]|nr:ATP-binding protein [Planctomycetaceae bacterium]